RKVATILEHEALAKSQRGDAEGACADAHRCALCARFCGDEYTLVSQLLRVTVMNVALGIVERGIANGEASEKTLVRLQMLFETEDAEVPDLLLHAVRAERALTHRMLEAFCDGRLDFSNFPARGERPDSFIDNVSMYFGATPMRRDHAAFLRLTN